MSLTRQPEQVKSLYLKQFFGRYFERKEMLEIISNFTNGLKVLQVIIQNFEHSQGIEHINKHISSHHNSKGFISDIGSEAQELNFTLQNIYDRLRGIFDSLSLMREKETEITLKTSRSFSNFNQGDEQLYEMLNTYKVDLKKQREQRKKIEKQSNNLSKELEHLQEENRFLNNKLHEYETSQKLTTLKLETLAQENQELKQQNGQLEIKMQVLFQAEETLLELKKENELLTLKCSESESKLKLLTEKFKAIDSLVLYKLQEKEEKWRQMIAQKLASVDIYQNPTCKVFRQFVTSFSKQNVRPNTIL